MSARHAYRFSFVVWTILFLLAGAIMPVQAQDGVAPSAPNDKTPLGLRQASAAPAPLVNEYLAVYGQEGGRFTIGTTGGDPATAGDDNRKLLYGFPQAPSTSFTSVRIQADGAAADYRLSSQSGDGVAPLAPPALEGDTLRTEYRKDGIRITERLYFSSNPDTGRDDLVTIEYTLQNETDGARRAGLRIMLDTMIGDNDGAPYFIQGAGQTTQQFEWEGSQVPAYWIAFESPTFDVNSLKARGQLAGGALTRPDRLVIADWAAANDTVWNYTVDPLDAVTNDSAVLLYYEPVRLGPGETRTVRTAYGIARAADLQTIDVTGIEVTQGVQNLRNAVGLLAERPTMVRVHVRTNGGAVPQLGAKLAGVRDGVPLPGSPLSPDNRNGSLTAQYAPVRTELEDSFYFELPESWLHGVIDLEVKVAGATFTCTDAAGLANDCRAQAAFAAGPAVEVRLVGIAWQASGQTHMPTEGDYREVERQLAATLPTAQIIVDRAPHALTPAFLDGPPVTAEQLARVNNLLAVQRILDGCLLGCNRYYLGVLVDRPAAAVGGVATGIPGAVASSYVTADLSHPHVLAHNTGRPHAYCSGGEPNPGEFPYADGRIGGSTDENDVYFGFDVSRKLVYGPNSGELMSDCAPRWISDYTYNAIRAALAAQYGSLHSEATALQAGEPAILVTGEVALNQWGGSFSSIYSLPAPGAAALPAAGDYTISLRDATGTQLAAYSFAPAIPSEGEIGTFALLLPKPSGTQQMFLLHDGHVLDSRSANGSPPAVTLLSPNGNERLTGSEAMAQWQASDADFDPLLFVLQYSADGGQSWLAVAANLTGTSYPLPLPSLPGGDNSLLRVIASDGLHSSSDVSDAPFSVAKHPPAAAILSPQEGARYVGNQTITLRGSGIDVEDGTLTADAHYQWASDQNGALGNGRSLALNAAQLAEGRHQITLTVSDRDGETATAVVSITVSRTTVPLPADWSINPDKLYFAAIAGGTAPETQLLSIRNRGDGEFQWNATDDQSWLVLSSLGATTPSDILVGIDLTGLTAGVYTATIRFTSSQISDAYLATVQLKVTDRSPAQIEVAASKLVLPADGQSQAQIVVTVSNGRGERLPNQTVAFATNLGAITPSAMTDAQGMATATLTAGTTVGVARITVSAGSAAKSIELLLSAGPAAAIRLTRSTDSSPVYGASAALITAVVTDAQGRPVMNQPVQFTTTLGTITPSTVTDAAGAATVLLQGPNSGGAATITATAGAVQTTLVIELEEASYRLLLPFASE